MTSEQFGALERELGQYFGKLISAVERTAKAVEAIAQELQENREGFARVEHSASGKPPQER